MWFIVVIPATSTQYSLYGRLVGIALSADWLGWLGGAQLILLPPGQVDASNANLKLVSN
jgi:hypothetical protein